MLGPLCRRICQTISKSRQGIQSLAVAWCCSYVILLSGEIAGYSSCNTFEFADAGQSRGKQSVAAGRCNLCTVVTGRRVTRRFEWCVRLARFDFFDLPRPTSAITYYSHTHFISCTIPGTLEKGRGVQTVRRKYETGKLAYNTHFEVCIYPVYDIPGIWYHTKINAYEV